MDDNIKDKDIVSDVNEDISTEEALKEKHVNEVVIEGQEQKIEKSGFFYDWIVPIAIAVVLAVLINKFIVFKVKIPSESMVPTLNVEDRLFVTRVYNKEKLQRGDVVVFYSHEFEESMIKRLIGLPGDKVVIKKGVVTVNGETLTEDYIGTPDNFSGSYEVPEGKFFFLGDNRLWSKDSRYWQNPYIDAKDIKGKAQVKVYPLSDLGWIK